MASAAGMVLIQSLRALNAPIQLASHPANLKFEKPSAFGTVLASSAAPDVKLSEPQIVKAGNRAVVMVTGWDPNDQPLAQGPGYVYSANGIIVTSYSAIRGASSLTIETASGAELNVIALMGYSVSRDLAVVAVLEGNLPALETGAGDVVQEGDAVVAVGPGNATSKGVVGPRRAVGGVDLMQITASAPTGSPVLNEHGKVIGLATLRHGETLAIPSRYIADLLAEHRVISFDQMLQETARQ
jgi:S1-C subfamily serine protease